MNYKMMGRFLSLILAIEGVFMLPALAISLFRGETMAVNGFLAAIGIIALLWLILFLLCRGAPSAFYAKEGMVCVGISWIALSLTGCLPFWISREIPSFIDAFFETVSGFTTTGSSILSDVEALSRGLLYWRSFSHWLGGMGVLVFLLAIIPGGAKGSGFTMHLLRAESPGPNVGKLVPKMRTTAMILYVIYVVLTVIDIIFLLIGGMSLFEAVCTAFGTAGTGGFGIKNDSIAGYSPYLQNVTTVFMILFGVNFSCYYLLLLRQWKGVFKDEELRLYFGIILGAIALIVLDLRDFYGSLGETVRHAAFQVGSIITTTGFATVDFNFWHSAAKTVLVLLMFCGACAGSTGGGIKVSRIIVFVKSAVKEVGSYIHPRSIKRVKVEGRPVEHEAIRSINVYLTTYVLIFVLSVFLISLEGKDLVTTFTAVAATINNIGPGLELVGPTASFAHMTDLSKVVLIFDMLAGRLELFPMLILFHPTIWKQAFCNKKGGQV